MTQNKGNLIKLTGDGILATFDGPGRAICCALALEAAARRLGRRCGRGFTPARSNYAAVISEAWVHAAARVMAKAGSDEVIVSRS